jgi:predicted nucleic acid-binding protein
VARIIVLDSGPLGDACRKRGHPNVEALAHWRHHARANGAIIAIPEIADYEVRRGLLSTGAADGLRRLDFLQKELRHFIPISSAAMRKAAELWADARRKGAPTAAENEIDGDVILAAQAILDSGAGDSLVIATYNARHLSRYHVDAQHWDEIDPYSPG